MGGNTDVQIGTDAAAGGNVPHNPFDNISAVVAVAGTLVPDAPPSRIILRTGKTNLPQASPAQQYGITATGFDLLDPSGLEGQVSPSGEYLDPMRNHSCVCPLVDHSATSISSNGLLTRVQHFIESSTRPSGQLEACQGRTLTSSRARL